MRPAFIAAAAAAVLVVALVAVPFKLSDGNGATLDGSRAGAAPVVALVSPRGVVVPVVGRETGGWRVRTPCGGEAVVSGGKPLTTATVVLDPGHGGEDSGAVGPNGLKESDLNLAVARRAKAAFERARVPVVLTRDGSYNMTLEARALLVTGLRPRAFVSVHHNSLGSVRSVTPGTETYYQAASPDSRRLAGLVYEEASRALGGLGGPWVAAIPGAKYMLGPEGRDYLGMLRRTDGVPSTLVEMAYLTHAPEARLLARPETHRIEGEALARAVLRYLDTPDPGSGYVDPSPPPRDRPGGMLCRDPEL